MDDGPVRLSPETIGPYRMIGQLGRGGMGVVYRAVHVDTGEAVAVKTAEAPSERALSGIRREIHALSRLQHPGLVRIVAQGVSAGLPWYAMELLEGRTLGDYVTEVWAEAAAAVTAPTDPTTPPSDPAALPERPGPAPGLQARSLRATYELGWRLCAPLAYLHGSGIVHRDVKPENVFLRPDGTPVLVDLGIAGKFGGSRGREELTAEGKIMGSLPYMSPEQIRGELVDARADLYALGCTLYECVTGRPPFTGASVASVFYQHLNADPVPPSQRAAGLPPGLDDLLLKLLEKRPRDRLGYADDVAEALRSLLPDRDVPPSSLSRSRPYLYRPELVGREAALEQLERAVFRAGTERRGKRIFIGGESGVGKTRLAMEVTAFATKNRIDVITGQCVALAYDRVAGGPRPPGVAGRPTATEIAAAPLHPFRPLLLAVADRCREKGAAETARLLGPRSKVLAAYEPSMADIPGQADEPEPPSLPPAEALARTLSSLKATLFALAEAKPLLLVLDDLQWADELSLDFLAQLSEADVDGRAVLLVGTYRMEEMREDLQAIVRLPGAVNVELRRLDAAGVGAMVSGMLALREPPPALIDVLDRQSDGNPFFIAEYLQAAIEGGTLTRSRAGAWQLREPGQARDALEASLPLPRTLAELIERRLLDLGETGRAVVDLGAVLGREFDGDLLAVTSGVEDPALLAAIETLRVRQVMEEPEPGRLRFVHDKIREIAYERIPDEPRRALHRKAADAIEARHGQVPDAYPELANHFARAEVHDKASLYFTRAGDRARRAHANGDAIASFRIAVTEGRLARAAAGSPETAVALEPTAAVLDRLGDVLSIVGRHEEARAVYADALPEIPEEDRLRRARTHRKIGKTQETQHLHAEALRAYTAAEEALGDPPAQRDDAWQEVWVEIQIDRVSVHYWLGQADAIAALVWRVRPVVEVLPVPLLRARFFQALTQQGVSSERYVVSEETVRYARACLTASDASNKPEEIAWAGFGLATVLLLRGELEEAERQMMTALRQSERSGNLPLQSRCLAYLATIQRKRGWIDDVRALSAKTLGVSIAAGMAAYAGAARGHLAWVAFREGDLDRVVREGEAALSQWSGLAGYTFPFQWIALFPLFAAKLDLGRVEDAGRHARAMLEESQQRLPDELARGLEEAGHAGHLGGLKVGETALARLRPTLRAAARLGYL